MYWIHALGALGVSMEATGPDPTIDTPQQIGMVVREPGAHQAVPGFPLTVGAEHGQGLDRALQRITSALLDAAESDRVVVAPGAHLMMEMLERSCWRQGLPMVRRAAREEGLNLRVVDPVLLDRWWDRNRRAPVSLSSSCRHHGVDDPAPGRVQQEASSSVDLLRAVMDLARDADGLLTRLGSGRWEGPRWMELRTCQDADDLHRLSERWNSARGRAQEADQARRAA